MNLLTDSKKIRLSYQKRASAGLFTKKIHKIILISIVLIVSVNAECMVKAETPQPAPGQNVLLKNAAWLIARGFHIYQARPDSGIFYAEKGLSIALVTANQPEASKAYQLLGHCYAAKGNSEAAENSYLKALTIRRKLNDRKLIANTLLSLSHLYTSMNLNEKALKFCTESYNTFKPATKKAKATANADFAWIYHSLGQSEKSLSFCDTAIQLFIECGEEAALNNLYQLKGIIYQDCGLYEKSILNYKKCLELQQKLNDSSGIAYNLHNISGIYYQYLDKEIAKQYTRQAFEIFTKLKNRNGIGYVLNGTGQNFAASGEYDSALVCFFKALPHFVATKNTLNEAFVLGNIGDVLMQKGDLAKAKNYLNRSVRKSEQIGNKFSLCNNFCSLGKLYSKLNDNDSAMLTLLKGLALAREISLKETEKECCYLISQIYESKHDYKNAYSYFNLYSTLNDSLFREESMKAVAEYRTKYETEKKEIKIQRLINDNLMKKNEIQNKKMWIWVIGAISLLFVVSALIITYLYAQRYKAYRKIVEMDLEAVKAEKDRNDHEPPRQVSHDLIATIRSDRPTITDEVTQRITDDLYRFLVLEKNYLNPDLLLADVAGSLNTNTAYVSRIINEKHGINFASYLNELRIKEARHLLSETKYRNISIEGIAMSVGFNSKSSFYSAFKKFTGVTPSFYLISVKNIQNQKKTA